jgi:hypothetical protein
MKYIMYVWNIVRRIAIFIWDFIFLFFGMPYEEQGKKLDFDKYDKDIRGPENMKTKKTVYRANKVGSTKNK